MTSTTALLVTSTFCTYGGFMIIDGVVKKCEDINICIKGRMRVIVRYLASPAG